jgi:hypothetical protein
MLSPIILKGTVRGAKDVDGMQALMSNTTGTKLMSNNQQ